MEDFDGFFAELIEESKVFLEYAKKTSDVFSERAFLHSSMLLSMSALEAGVNSIIEDILIEPYLETFSIHEQGLLLEKEVRFKSGRFVLSNSLKISRLLDRIDFILEKYSKPSKRTEDFEKWYGILKQNIDIRNRLVHPKKNVTLSISQVENTILSVLEVLNQLCLFVYQKGMPIFNIGLSSTESLVL